MKFKNLLICLVAGFAIATLSASHVLTQEAEAPTEISIYGDVQAVDTASNSITVQYYDFDTDEEKTIELVLDKDTKIENAAGINEIKKGDWVDVSYSVSEGKNVAKSVIVEKEEEFVPEEGGEGAEE